MKQSIAFSRGLVTLPNNGPFKHYTAAVSCAAEIARLGFVLDIKAIDRLATLSFSEQRAWTNELVTLIRGKIGASRPYKPFYVNFPQDVMEMSHLELFINAIVHYWSNGTWEPAQELVKRGPLREEIEMSKLTFVSEDDFLNIFTELVAANQSMSEFNKKAVEWFVKTYPKSKLVITSVPFKETMAMLVKLGVDVPVKNETDVLRIAMALSDADPALLPIPKTIKSKKTGGAGAYRFDPSVQPEREKHKFKKFSRPERKYLLSMLESTDPMPEDMMQHLGRWLRLGEILHVGEYASKFPKSFAAFDRLRKQDPKVRTFASNYEYAMKNGDLSGALKLLKKRPGEFARRLDSLLRKGDEAHVLLNFADVVERVSSKVLLEMYEHIHGRAEVTTRTIQAKGSRGASSLEVLEPLDPKVVESALNILQTGLMYGLAKLPPMGKVYIDEELKNLSLLKGARTMGDAVKSFARGTRLPFPDNAKTIRGFIHWFDQDGHEDLDLSARLLDSNFNYIDHISFTNLKGSNCYHSGDIRHRRGSCAEYVDFNVEQLPKSVRYATLEVYNFNARPLNSVKDCVSGFMARQAPQSGEIFEPMTVKNAMSPSSAGTTTLLCVFDFKEKNVIWADLDAAVSGRYIEQTEIQDILRFALKKPAISAYELIKLHVAARGGELVKTEAEADQSFTFDTLSVNHEKLAGLATW